MATLIPRQKILCMCNLLFRDKGRVSHPQKQSPKGEDDSCVPTSTKENESYRTTEERWVEQPAHRPGKGIVLPARDRGPPLAAAGLGVGKTV